MKGTISSGTILTLGPPESIEEGDLVVYERNGILLCHRVVEVEGESVLTEGENCPLFDFPVEKSHLLARVIEPVRPKATDPPYARPSLRPEIKFILVGGETDHEAMPRLKTLGALLGFSVEGISFPFSTEEPGAELRSMAAGAPLIGVSPLAKVDVADLPALCHDSRVVVVLNGNYGLRGSGLIPLDVPTAIVRLTIPKARLPVFSLEEIAIFLVGFLRARMSARGMKGQ